MVNQEQRTDAASRPIGRVATTLIALAIALTACIKPSTTPADIPAACGTVNPFFATTRFPLEIPASGPATGPAVVAFRDTDGNDPAAQLTLASQSQVGAVFGLAYDAAKRQLYTAAYQKRGAPFGPGGPGGIYRVEVVSGTVTTLAKLPAGPDMHDLHKDDDAKAIAGVGQSSLGGLALSDDGATLFAANLSDGKVYRLATKDGAVLGSFANGGKATAWASKARLFALAWHDGALYHGVVNGDDPPSAHVYKSAADGSGMSEVVNFSLDYGRRPPWSSWDSPAGGPTRAQPMLTDLVFRSNGNLVLGLRDRRVDTGLYADGPVVFPGGDILPAWRSGPGWQVIAQPEIYQDDTAGDEVTWGSLALFPGLDATVASAADVVAVPGGRGLVGGQALWFDNVSGKVTRTETLYHAASTQRNPLFLHGLGDVEALCPAGAKYPALGGTATSNAATALYTATAIAAQTISPTLTAEATRSYGTATAAAATRTAGVPATATAVAINDKRLRDSCGTDNPMFFVTCFVRDYDLNQVGGDPAIVAFNDTPNDDMASHIPLASQGQVGATYGLAFDWRRRQLYAGAFHKRATFFGPGGPGALYQLDLTTGDVKLWAQLDAGPDWHQLAQGIDESAAQWVGKTSLGDIEISAEGDTLFVTNLWDRRIYRLSVPDGAILDSFPAGPPADSDGAEPAWSVDARPFGLGYRDGWLYHGVVDSAERTPVGGIPVGYVYRSRPDGSEMTEVMRFDMDYGRPAGMLWSPWLDNPGTNQPILSDIEFRPNGDPILGLRDRRGDTLVQSIGQGDILPTRRNGDRWDVVTTPEHYADLLAHDETTWGALAAFPGRDWVVSTALAPVMINSGGALWYDNETGAILRPETVYDTYRGNVTLPTFAKSEGLGDIEGACPPLTVETPTPGSTTEPSPTSTSSPTSTTTATPRSTSVPKPIYLPVLVSEDCKDREQHADVVIVVDVSTSMDRPTSTGRKKIEAAQDAVRAFLGEMVFTDTGKGFDQVGLVGFNSTAWIEQPLSHSGAALQAAVTRLPTRYAQGTRLDLALDRGREALFASGHRPGNTPVLILMTDGLPNGVPPAEDGTMETTVLRAAARAKAAGAHVYTIGLGDPNAPDILDRINVPLMTAIASQPSYFFQTPDAEKLRAIYAQIAYTIGCPGGRHDWGKPWP